MPDIRPPGAIDAAWLTALLKENGVDAVVDRVAGTVEADLPFAVGSSVLGTVYGFWLVYAAGLQYMLAGAVFFALGNLVFIWARKEAVSTEPMFTKLELLAAVALVILGVLAMWMLFTGHLTQVYSP